MNKLQLIKVLECCLLSFYSLIIFNSHENQTKRTG